jgi:hypothetical protein
MGTQPSTSSCAKQETFCASNLAMKWTKSYKTVNQREVIQKHSHSKSYWDTDKEPESDRNYNGNVKSVRRPVKRKTSNENLLLS